MRECGRWRVAHELLARRLAEGMPLLRYAATIFLGAFLLFQVQPLISKYILPWFGGTPAVWTTCVLFFQLLLLGGYAYAHLVATKLAQRRQVVLHLAVVAVALALLPIAPGARWKPESVEHPTWHILVLLGACVGMPYFVLATTSPLLQAWFCRTHPGRSPYRLYALSNVGSLLALVSFPFVVEPALSSPVQARVWSWGFVLFAAACAYCAARTWRHGSEASEGAQRAALSEPRSSPGLGQRVLWVALPACASVLLLAVTNQMCQDVAVVPFLWVLPLGLYLLSFIICFESETGYVRPLFWLWLGGAVVAMTMLMHLGPAARIQHQVLGFSLGLFGCCMVCHGELVRLKPGPRHLTSFYLMVSAGGALGGVFVSVIAPAVFDSYLELHCGLWACCVLAIVAFWVNRRPHREWPRSWAARIGVPLLLAAPFFASAFGLPRRLGLAAGPLATGRTLGVCAGAAAVVLVFRAEWRPARRSGQAWLSLLYVPAFAVALLFLGQELSAQARGFRAGSPSVSRNFYGVLRVTECFRDSPRQRQYRLRHGRIVHGAQFLSEEGRRRPVAYFSEEGGIGLMFRHHPRREGGRRVGVLGLGVGTVAAYGKKGDRFRFYEINPEVARLATSLFTYLADSEADCEVILGDGRLVLEREESQHFDILILDAFSGDAIPVHLLTREAFGAYLRHLGNDGVIAVNVANRYIDLNPVVSALAGHFGLKTVLIQAPSDPARGVYASGWMLVTKNTQLLENPAVIRARTEPDDAARRTILWTDNYSNLFRVLR